MIIRQAFSLLRQNPFFSTVSIIGTAVSIAFVMVVYMVYDIQTANIRPESHRDRMVYSSYGYSYRKADHSNANTGMSYQAACRIFADLPGAELVTYMSYTTMEYCGVSPEKGQRCQNRRVDLNFWRLYDIRFVAGRPFDQQEFDACADVVVIAERLAREAFGSAEEALGKNYFVDFYPKRVVGVTEDVSSLFAFAYGEVWLPYYTQDPAWGSEGLRGGFEAMVLCEPGVSPAEMKLQIENSLDRLNASLTEYELTLPDLSTYTERQFFRDDFLNPMVTCIMLGLILLIVPAINVSGLISSQMSRRLSELAVRKAYGASRSTLVWQCFLRICCWHSLVHCWASCYHACCYGWGRTGCWQVDIRKVTLKSVSGFSCVLQSSSPCWACACFLICCPYSFRHGMLRIDR